MTKTCNLYGCVICAFEHLSWEKHITQALALLQPCAIPQQVHHRSQRLPRFRRRLHT